MFGPTIETMLKAEPGARLGCPSNDKSPKPTANRRNGHAPKTVRASAGEPEVAAPRDRGGPFEPAAAPKGPSGPSDMEGRVMSVCARGMSQRGIAPTVRETRGFPMGAETVSAMTDRVWEELERRRSRPLEPACAFLFVDRLHAPAGKGRGARNAAACVAPGYDLQGRKDAPGLWVDESGGPAAGCRPSTSCAGAAWRTPSAPAPAGWPGSRTGRARSSPSPGPGAAPSTWCATP